MGTKTAGYNIYKDKEGKFYFIIVAQNRRILARSEKTYDTLIGAKNGCHSITQHIRFGITDHTNPKEQPKEL